MKGRVRWTQGVCVAVVLLSFAGGLSQAGEIQDDPGARALLEDARRQVVVWDRFPGFQAKLTVDRDGNRSGGEVMVPPSGKVQVELQDKETAEWVGRILKSLVNHRLKTETHRHEDAPVTFGPQDQHPQGRLVKKGDRLSSTYRIKDGQILQVNQKNEKGWLSLNILEYTPTPHGALPKQVAVFQFDDKGALTTSTVFTDEYVEIGGFWLPGSRVIITAQGNKVEVSRLRLQGHRLLPADAAKTPGP